MNGVINIYKEPGYSSFHVVYELRKLTGEQKVGHTGTLDPEVSGVLPICLGKATKLVGQLTDTDKAYHCTMLLGKSTDTQDDTGNTISDMSPELVSQALGDDSTALTKIKGALTSFIGDIMQVPPMYSALKVGGMKLVNAARKGIEVERKPRKVTVYSIDNINFVSEKLHVIFDVRCSKGTYIRTLCQDAGEKLGIPSCMLSLERTYAAGLGLDTAITLDQVREYASQGILDRYIIRPDLFLEVYPSVVIRDEMRRKVLYGNYFREDDVSQCTDSDSIKPGQTFRVYDADGVFYALYQYDGKKKCFICIKMFIDI